MPQPVQYRGMALIVPDNDSEWKEFYEHARAHRLVVRQCKACGLMRYPPTHACPWCMDLGWTWQEVSGRGTIYSYEIVAHAIQPGFKELTPYAVVLVELDEQRGQPTPDEALRGIANLVKADFTPEPEANVATAKRARVRFPVVAASPSTASVRSRPARAAPPTPEACSSAPAFSCSRCTTRSRSPSSSRPST